MKTAGAPRVAHRVGRSSQATPAAVDNSAPLQNRPSSLIYRGWAVQTNRATSDYTRKVNACTKAGYGYNQEILNYCLATAVFFEAPKKD